MCLFPVHERGVTLMGKNSKFCELSVFEILGALKFGRTGVHQASLKAHNEITCGPYNDSYTYDMQKRDKILQFTAVVRTDTYCML